MRDFSPAMEKIKLRFPKRNIELAYALCRKSSREKRRNAGMRECVNWVSLEIVEYWNGGILE
jgi:hypothetical protein